MNDVQVTSQDLLMAELVLAYHGLYVDGYTDADAYEMDGRLMRMRDGLPAFDGAPSPEDVAREAVQAEADRVRLRHLCALAWISSAPERLSRLWRRANSIYTEAPTAPERLQIQPDGTLIDADGETWAPARFDEEAGRWVSDAPDGKAAPNG